MIRSICAVCLGLIVAMIGIVVVEGLSSILHPFPPGVDATDLEACKAHVARYPTAVLVLLGVIGWGLTAFVSTWLATRLGTSRHLAHGVAVGTILFAAAVFNMAMLPYPIWFWVNLIVLPACISWGTKLGLRNKNKHLSSDGHSVN